MQCDIITVWGSEVRSFFSTYVRTIQLLHVIGKLKIQLKVSLVLVTADMQ